MPSNVHMPRGRRIFLMWVTHRRTTGSNAMRLLVGPNHRHLLPASLFGGAIFLMLTDLLARVVLSPLELPIGVITSLIGSVVFVFIFYHSRKAR